MDNRVFQKGISLEARGTILVYTSWWQKNTIREQHPQGWMGGYISSTSANLSMCTSATISHQNVKKVVTMLEN
jgi:hypothetical protein